jgi:hydrogenase maturation protease
MRTLVIGLGNPILTDDGVGVKVANEVWNNLDPATREQVTVTEASVGGLRLMEMMIHFDRVILIDALIPTEGSIPGRIQRMTLEDLRSISPTQHSASSHDTTLITALDLGREMDLALPTDITIFAIEVENVTEFSDSSTESVSAAIPEATAAVMEELHRCLAP